MAEVSYGKRLVAFIDILGFSSLISKSKTNETIIKDISVALKRILDIKKENDDREKGDGSLFGAEVSTFSDSIVVSYPVPNNSSLFVLLLEIIYLQIDLMAQGFLLRGGITIGELYHKDQICFGPAMNEAYFLESKVANYPRIIIEEKTIFEGIKLTYAEQNGLQGEAKFIERLVKKSTDGIYYLDFMSQSGELDFIGGEYVKWMRDIRPLIVNGLNENRDRLDVFIKYYWLMNYYNETILEKGTITPPRDADITQYIEEYKELVITNQDGELFA